MGDFPKALRHGPLREILPDVFVVRGTFPIGPLVTITRNMIVLRDGGELTLVNAVRLSEEGERQLCALGDVRQLVKLGFFHDRDDPYFRARFAPRFWTSVPADAHSEELRDGEPGPLARGMVHRFVRARQGEAALLVDTNEGRLLVTCDSLQNWTDTADCSLLGALTVRAMGFLRPAKIGPIWLDKMTGGKIDEMRPDFERLLARGFDHLIAGHGELLRGEAKAAVGATCARTFGS